MTVQQHNKAQQFAAGGRRTPFSLRLRLHYKGAAVLRRYIKNTKRVHMPILTNYRLFISHSWAYGDAYEKLVQFFNEYPNFNWTDYSVPKNDPIHDAPSSKALYEAIKRQVSPVNCVIILAGVYSSYSTWINNEIAIAKQVYSKPIVAIEPWASERTSKVVRDNADVIVKWNSGSIVKAIREYSI